MVGSRLTRQIHEAPSDVVLYTLHHVAVSTRAAAPKLTEVWFKLPTKGRFLSVPVKSAD